jgi:ribosomal protein S12 methylthiotransferase accessory factor
MSIPGGGKGPTQQQPVLGALGELAERLLSILHFSGIVDQLEYGTWKQMVSRGYNALHPADIPLFAPEQHCLSGFPFAPFRPDTPVRWIRATELLSGEEIFVPAQLVLLYYKRVAGEGMIGYPTSGGLAFHADRRIAILHALYEYIERDAINVRWYCHLPPPRVDIELRDFLSTKWHLRDTRVTSVSLNGIELYLNTLDVPIPVFTVVAIDNSRSERAFLGAGGAWSHRDRALAQALFELGQTRAVLNSYRPGKKCIRADSSTKEMTEFLDGAIYFGYAQNLRRFSWYVSSGTIAWNDVPTARLSDETSEYDYTTELLRQLGLKPIVLDFAAACWPGVSVVKVMIPELTAACVAAHPYLGHPRYYESPQRLGLANHRLAFGDLNEDPIPFP